MSRLRAIRHYYDADQGRMIELTDDVLGIVSQVRESYGTRVGIHHDPLTGWFHFVEYCEDGAERLIFSTEELDSRSLERLLRSDSQWRGHEDPYDAIEVEQDKAHEEIDAQYRERLADAGERMAHALKRDGLEPRLPLSLPVERKRA